MLVFAYSQGGATATGLVSLALLIPTALFAPFCGPAIDRFGATRVLLGAHVGQAIAMAATATSMLCDAPALVTYGFGALTAMLLVVTHPAHSVVAPGIAHTTEQLVALNAITGWILSIGLVVAPAGAGLILAGGPPGAVYAAGSVCVALAAILVVPLRDLVPPNESHADTSAPSALRDLGRGARALAHSSAPREVIIVLGATFMMVGALDVLVVVLAVGSLGIGESGAGYLTAAHGAGAVLGAAVSLALIGRRRLVPVIVGASLLAAGAFAVLAMATSTVIAFIVAATTGAARSLLEVTGQTLLQRVTPTDLFARVFAFKEGIAMAAWGIGSVLVTVVIASTDVRGALIFAAAIVPVLLLLRIRPLLAVDSAATIPTVRIALLRSVVALRSLPGPVLEGVALNATEVDVPAGAAIVREGEPGDCYYAIANGSVDVLRGGARVNTLQRGEGFGEISLVDDISRTATVVAVTETRLVVVEREPFLIALTGHAPTRERIDRVARERRPVIPV